MAANESAIRIADRGPLIDYMLRRTVISPSPSPLGMCWLLTQVNKTTGYGRVYINRVGYLAHRISWQLFRGEVTDETIDHLCRNRACWNPDHLEPTSRGDNTRREGNSLKASCPKGYPYDIELNDGRKHRACSACRKEANKRFRESNPNYQRLWRANRG